MGLALSFSVLLTAGVCRADSSTGAVLPHYQPKQSLSGDARFTVETSAEALALLLVEPFKKYHPNLELIVKGTSPLASVPMVLSGAYDLGFPAREIWANEEELFQKFRGYPPFAVQIGLGAQKATGLTPTLAVFVNANNPITKITVDQLDAIYSSERRRGLGKDVKTWGDLGVTGEWASRPIHAYSHRQPNGIDFFVQKTVTKGAEFKKSVIELPMRQGKLGPDDVMARATVQDPMAIGLGCFGNVIPGMKTIAVAETASGPYYTGTEEEVKSLKYPLYRPIYMVVDRTPGKPIAPILDEFLRFVLSVEGQKAIAASPEGWLPLPDSVAALERARLN